MKKIISVFLSFIFCFAGTNKQVFAGWDNPLIEHKILLSEFIERDYSALKLMSDSEQGAPVSLTRKPEFMDTFGDEYREIRMYNIPCLLDQRTNSDSFLVEFRDALEKLEDSMPKLKELAKKNKNNLDEFLNDSVPILKSKSVDKLAKALNVPEEVVAMGLVTSTLLLQNKSAQCDKAAVLLQSLGLTCAVVGAALLAGATISAMLPTTGTTAVATTGTAGTAGTAAGTTAGATAGTAAGTTAGATANMALAVKESNTLINWASFLIPSGGLGFLGGAYRLEKDSSIKQKLLREKILNYAKLFKLLMEEITNYKKVMRSNVLVIAVDNRDFSNFLFWNANRDNHGAWAKFEYIRDLKCSPCAKDCKTRDGYTMEKYIEEMKKLIEGTNYKKDLACFEDIKGEKDIDKVSMCVCF